VEQRPDCFPGRPPPNESPLTSRRTSTFCVRLYRPRRTAAGLAHPPADRAADAAPGLAAAARMSHTSPRSGAASVQRLEPRVVGVNRAYCASSRPAMCVEPSRVRLQRLRRFIAALSGPEAGCRGSRCAQVSRMWGRASSTLAPEGQGIGGSSSSAGLVYSDQSPRTRA